MIKKMILATVERENSLREPSQFKMRFESFYQLRKYEKEEIESTIKEIKQLADEELDVIIQDEFSCGKIEKLHTIGQYQIIEYVSTDVDTEEWQIRYKPFVNYNDIPVSYTSLDDAILAAISHSKLDFNGAMYATGFIKKMLEV